MKNKTDNKIIKKAIFVGSFDPFTCGHENIVIRSLELFDEIIIVVGENYQKKYLFPLEKRINIIEKIFTDYENISVVSFSGLTVDFCKKNNINFIIRGIRNFADFESEQILNLTNKMLMPSVETIFLFANPTYFAISSSAFREIWKYNGNINDFLPSNIKISDFK